MMMYVGTVCIRPHVIIPNKIQPVSFLSLISPKHLIWCLMADVNQEGLRRTQTQEHLNKQSEGQTHKPKKMPRDRNRTEKNRNGENVRRTLVIMFFLGYGVRLPPWLTFSPARPLFRWLWRLCSQLSLWLDQQGRLPFDWVAQMHGQTLVLPLVVTNQIVNSLKKCLIQTPCCLMKQEQHKVNITKVHHPPKISRVITVTRWAV